MNCPHCGHTITTPKPRKPHAVESSDTRQMSDTQLYAYYKRIAPLEDCRFWLRNARMSDQLRAGFLALESSAQVLTIPRAEFYRQLTALQALWRRESNARERQAHLDNGEVLIDGFWTMPESFIEVPTVFEKSA